MQVGFSGANFAVADTGSVCVVESEGNGRMCLTLPRVLITLVGIEKVDPVRSRDLEVFLQLLPRSATGERMNPYNSIWTGVTAGDGPEEFHVVLLDNGRTHGARRCRVARDADCIRCGACLNACPVYRQTGGHAYGSIYSGPIGAILTPQLQSMEHSQSLPVRVVAVRRLLRGLSGQDQHSGDPDPPAADAWSRRAMRRSASGWR